jgi:hypothetical protein
MFDIIISLNKRGIKRKVVAAVWRCPPGTWQRAGSGEQNSRYSGFANPELHQEKKQGMNTY